MKAIAIHSEILAKDQDAINLINNVQATVNAAAQQGLKTKVTWLQSHGAFPAYPTLTAVLEMDEDFFHPPQRSAGAGSEKALGDTASDWDKATFEKLEELIADAKRLRSIGEPISNVKADQRDFAADVLRDIRTYIAFRKQS